MISLLGIDAKVAPGNHNSSLGFDKSIVDDFVASSYCKCESILVIRSTEVFAAFLRFVLSCFSIVFQCMHFLCADLWGTIFFAKFSLQKIVLFVFCSCFCVSLRSSVASSADCRRVSVGLYSVGKRLLQCLEKVVVF